MRTRKNALQRLIDKSYGGVAADLARDIGIDPSYLSRCLWPMEKKGAKAIGIEIRDKIAEKHPFWDLDHLPAFQHEKISGEGALSKEENDLINLFRLLKTKKLKLSLIGAAQDLLELQSNEVNALSDSASYSPASKKAKTQEKAA